MLIAKHKKGLYFNKKFKKLIKKLNTNLNQIILELSLLGQDCNQITSPLIIIKKILKSK